MEDFKRPQIENVQKSFDRAIAIFSEKTRLNMIDIKDWIGSFALYQAGRKAGLSSHSLVTLASELLTTKIINNRTDLDEVYCHKRLVN